MIKIDNSYLEDEIRDGFYIPAMTKRTWAMELTVLDLIDEICRIHGIKYFADWGTLLGAVRHGGFIPWDDDMDICMHRNDFERFKVVAESELPEGYQIMSFHNNDYSWKFIINVVPNSHMCFEPEYLKSHYFFPYIVAVDIFIMDNISDDKELEKERTKEVKRLLSEADRLVSEKDIERKRKIYDDVEKLLAIENDNVTKKIIQKIPWGVYHNQSYLKEEFKETIRIPFEITEIPVPLYYDRILRSKLGDYMQLIIGGGGHSYPYYVAQKKELGTEFDYPVLYKFSEEDLSCEKDFSHSLKSVSSEVIDYLKESRDVLSEIIENEKSGNSQYSENEIVGFLADIQENVVEYGALVESIKGNECSTIKSLEKLCETLFYLSNNICDSICFDNVSKEIDEITENIECEIIQRKTVLFLSYKKENWISLKKIHDFYSCHDDTDVYVVDLPIYYKDYDGLFEEKLNEDCIDISLLCPDVIITNYPYDEYNMTVSTSRNYYSRNIRKYTKKLTYVPYFKMMEFDSSNYPCWYNMQYYCTVPGVVMADEVYVQSENTRNNYIDKLTEWSGKAHCDKYKKIWDGKIKVAYEEKEKISDDIDSDSMDECKKSLGVGKAIVWYCAISMMAEYDDKYFEKLRRSLDVFINNKDTIRVLLISDESIDINMQKVNSKINKRWNEFCDLFVKSNVGEIVSYKTNDVNLCDSADAYYGDPSVICKDFIIAKKPVMIMNVDI